METIKVSVATLANQFVNRQAIQELTKALQTILKVEDSNVVLEARSRVEKKEYLALGYVEYFLDEELILKMHLPVITDALEVAFTIERFYE